MSLMIKSPNTPSDKNEGNEANKETTSHEIQKSDCLEKCEKAYTFSEYFLYNQGTKLNDQDRAGLRKVQSDMQRVRLWLLD